LRETGTALLLGSKTAGQAAVAQEFPLKNGERLRIATAPVQLGDGTLLGTNGVKPDISVNTNPQDERAYYNDAFKDLARSNSLSAISTNQAVLTNGIARRSRFNEAELVRERKEGTLPDSELAAEGAVEVEPLLVRDPALARALDVLKGLALVRQSHS
jgi:C-terminal processing protease CtpA/Prc